MKAVIATPQPTYTGKLEWKPLLKWLSPLLKPLFKLNHDRVMADGERGLRAELERRRSASAPQA